MAVVQYLVVEGQGVVYTLVVVVDGCNYSCADPYSVVDRERVVHPAEAATSVVKRGRSVMRRLCSLDKRGFYGVIVGIGRILALFLYFDNLGWFGLDGRFHLTFSVFARGLGVANPFVRMP